MTIFDSVRMKCRTLLEAVNELFAMGGELEQKVDNQEEELVNMQSVMGEVQAGFSDVREEMDALTDRVDTVEQTYDPEQLNTIKGDISAIEDDIQLLTAGVNGTQSRMDDVEESNAQAVATVQELSETVATYDSEIANLKSTDVNTMQQVLQQGVELDNEVTARTNADTTLQENIDTLDESVVKLGGTQTITGQKTFMQNINVDGGRIQFQNVTGYNDLMSTTGMDVNGRISMMRMSNNTTANDLLLYVAKKGSDGSNMSNMGGIGIAGKSEVIEVYATSPASASDNSSKIATTSWVNTASGVVHTTGNETVRGIKDFGRSIRIKMSDFSSPTGDLIFYSGDTYQINVTETGSFYSRKNLVSDGVYNNETSIKCSNGDNKSYIKLFVNSDGTSYAKAPATRTTGYETEEIATAGWVDAKLQALEARITALEGGA